MLIEFVKSGKVNEKELELIMQDLN